MLDYVPNHVAPDHPWLRVRPDCFLPGSEEELAQQPEAFLRTAGGIVAKGRDPYFPPWPDVVQLNAYAPALREAVAGTLLAIGGQCDGLRCDMAMLMTNDVFGRTWGARAGRAPAAEYWPALIERTRQVHPDLLFIAEAYWDMEWTLQRQGFDLCYDKRLYDRLAHDGAEAVRAHLEAEPAYQERLIRFIENHDEPRAAGTFAPAQARAAAVVMSTLEGARLYHDGQLDGLRTRIPVFLGRGPDEPPDDDLRDFYERLLRAVADAGLRDGDWRACACTGWPDNDSARQLVAWCWTGPAGRHLVVVNLAGAAGAGPRPPALGRPRRPRLDADRPARRARLRPRGRRAGRRRALRRARAVGLALPAARLILIGRCRAVRAEASMVVTSPKGDLPWPTRCSSTRACTPTRPTPKPTTRRSRTCTGPRRSARTTPRSSSARWTATCASPRPRSR